MRTSEQFSEVAKALVEARKKFSKAKKTGKNSHLGNTYANLTDILDAIQPALDEQNVMVTQSMLDSSTDKVMHIETLLLHSSGQFLAFQYNMPIEKTTAQAYGSTTSYGRRYALAAALGITQSDDDAEIAKRSPDSYKKLIEAAANMDDLRKVHESAKNSLTAAEWKIVEPALVERKTELNSAPVVAGFDPAKPVVREQVAKADPVVQNAPSAPIETFN